MSEQASVAASPMPSGAGGGVLKPKHKRFIWIIVGVAFVAAIVALVLNAFDSSVTYFYSPTEVKQDKVPHGRAFRIGGMVEDGSLVRDTDGLTVRFKVTDSAQVVPVVYTGILPDMFSEGKGVVAQGKLEGDGIFRATQVLAKHDENYVAPEVKAAMDEAHKANMMKTMK